MAQGAQTGSLAPSGNNDVGQKLLGNPTGDPSSTPVPGLSNCSAEDMIDIIASGSRILGQMPDGASPTSVSGANNIVSTGGFQAVGFDPTTKQVRMIAT